MEKYAFIGSHGTGKSSGCTFLGALLKREYREKAVKVIEENAREISRLAEGKLNTTAFQTMSFAEQLKQETFFSQLYDIVVCDRTLIDTLIYGLVHKVQYPSEYLTVAINHLNSFDQIFFVRPKEEDVIIDDNFRDTDKALRDQVDGEFERYLKIWGGDYQTIYSDEIFTFPYVDYLKGK